MKPYAIGLYEKAIPYKKNWKEKLRCAKESGFDFLEISIDETDEKLARLDWKSEQRRALIDDMFEIGIPIRSMCLSGHRKYPMGATNSRIRAKSLEILNKAIDFADDLGIRIIQLAGYDVYYEDSTEETKAQFAKNLRTATLMAAKKGILLGFETMETEFMNSVDKSMAYVSLIDSPYLGVYPDSGNITNAAKLYKTSVTDDIESGRGHIIAVHLKESKVGVYRNVPYMTGHVNFEAIIEKAWSLGVRRYVIEMWDNGQENWKDEIRFASKSIREILNKQL